MLATAYLSDRGLEAKNLRPYRLGVVVEPAHGHEHAQNRLSIPYLTPTGPVGVKFRCLEAHACGEVGCARYTYPVGHRQTLYNTGTLVQDHPFVVLTEGELDAIAVETLTGLPAVAYPGVATWKGNRYWGRCFAGYETVFVIADGDKPGRKAAADVADDIVGSAVVNMPDGHDSNSFLAAYGWETYLERLGF